MKLLERVKNIYSNFLETNDLNMRKHKRQYTKIFTDVFLIIFCIVILASCFINLKNGANMDAIAVEMIKVSSKIFVVYCTKGFFETKAEKEHSLKVMELNKENENGYDQYSS